MSGSRARTLSSIPDVTGDNKVLVSTLTGVAWSNNTIGSAAYMTGPTGAIVGTSDQQTLTNKTLTGLRETKTTSSANNFNLLDANYFTHTVSGSTVFSVSNIASAGSVSSFILDLTNGGSASITWWSGIKWAGGTPPTLTASGRDVLGFFTHDGGTVWNGLVLAKDIK